MPTIVSGNTSKPLLGPIKKAKPAPAWDLTQEDLPDLDQLILTKKTPASAKKAVKHTKESKGTTSDTIQIVESSDDDENDPINRMFEKYSKKEKKVVDSTPNSSTTKNKKATVIESPTKPKKVPPSAKKDSQKNKRGQNDEEDPPTSTKKITKAHVKHQESPHLKPQSDEQNAKSLKKEKKVARISTRDLVDEEAQTLNEEIYNINVPQPIKKIAPKSRKLSSDDSDNDDQFLQDQIVLRSPYNATIKKKSVKSPTKRTRVVHDSHDDHFDEVSSEKSTRRRRTNARKSETVTVGDNMDIDHSDADYYGDQHDDARSFVQLPDTSYATKYPTEPLHHTPHISQPRVSSRRSIAVHQYAPQASPPLPPFNEHQQYTRAQLENLCKTYKDTTQKYQSMLLGILNLVDSTHDKKLLELKKVYKAVKKNHDVGVKKGYKEDRIPIAANVNQLIKDGLTTVAQYEQEVKQHTARVREVFADPNQQLPPPQHYVPQQHALPQYYQQQPPPHGYYHPQQPQGYYPPQHHYPPGYFSLPQQHQPGYYPQQPDQNSAPISRRTSRK